MIIHIALYKWKQRTKEEQVNEAFSKIKKLKGKVKEIKDIFCGKNYHPESKGYTHGIVVLAENQEALDNYRKHPDHKPPADIISKMEEDGIGFDFQDKE